jgi:hypothetical protein
MIRGRNWNMRIKFSFKTLKWYIEGITQMHFDSYKLAKQYREGVRNVRR